MVSRARRTLTKTRRPRIAIYLVLLRYIARPARANKIKWLKNSGRRLLQFIAILPSVRPTKHFRDGRPQNPFAHICRLSNSSPDRRNAPGRASEVTFPPIAPHPRPLLATPLLSTPRDASQQRPDRRPRPPARSPPAPPSPKKKTPHSFHPTHCTASSPLSLSPTAGDVGTGSVAFLRKRVRFAATSGLLYAAAAQVAPSSSAPASLVHWRRFLAAGGAAAAQAAPSSLELASVLHWRRFRAGEIAAAAQAAPFSSSESGDGPSGSGD